MSVVDVKEKWSERRAEEGTAGRGSSTVYTVLTSDPDDGNEVVLAAPQLPRMFQQHPKDPWKRCVGRQIRNWTSITLAEVEIRWAVDYNSDVGSGGDNPLLARPVISTRSETIVEAVDKDAAGRRICNSAGQGFDPPPQREFTDLIIEVSRNEKMFNWNAILAYTNTISRGNPMWRMADITASDAMDPKGFVYVQVRYTIKVRKEGWRLRLLDEGYEFIQAGSGRGPQKFIDRDGNPMTTPQKLNGRGDRLVAGNPVWLLFDKYPTADWTRLGLPV